MSIQDRLTGRLKQAAGDLLGDAKLRRQGLREERKADAKQELRDAQQEAEDKRDEVARLEYESAQQAVSRRSGSAGHPRPD